MNGRLKLAAGVAVLAVVALGGTAAFAGGGGGQEIRERLTGYEEVPAVSTAAEGRFRAQVRADGDQITYRLRWEDLEGTVTQSHIHFGQFSVNGAIQVFLCSNLGNGPAGTQECPDDTSSGSIEGTIEPDDVVGQTPPPAGQGIAPGEFDELVRAIRAGVTYVNVHSDKFPGGEIRAQLETKKH